MKGYMSVTRVNICGHMNGWMDGWIDAWMDRWKGIKTEFH